MGLKAMSFGAEDYIFKSELNSFVIEKSIAFSIERKRLASLLIESETRFRHMFEYSSIGIFRSTSDGYLIEVNNAYAEMFGYSNPIDALNNINNIAHQLYVFPEVRQKIIDELKNQKLKIKQIEVDFYKKDHSIFTGFLHIRISDISESEKFILEGYVQDITEKKKAEEQIKVNLQFLKDLMDNIPSPVFSKDINLKYTGCNKEFEKFIGFTEKEILGKTMPEVRADEQSKYLQNKDRELLNTEKKQEFEYETKYADGKKHNVIFHKNVLKDQHGKVSGIIGLILDITDKKIALERLREELSLNEAMTELSKQLLNPGISLHEISNLILNFTKKLTQSQHGYAGTIDREFGDLVLHTFTEMINDGCLVDHNSIRFEMINDEYPKLWGHALNTQQPFYTNSPQQHQRSGGVPQGHIQLHNFLTVPAILNGKLVGQIALANSARPFDDEDLEGVKKLTNLYSLAIEKQRSVEEMIFAREKAELSDKLKSAFLANMSHEIRTPLNAIVGFAQMLGEEGIEPAETSEFKNVILKNTDLLLRLISDIIEMAMIEAGELKIHSEIRSVDDTLKQVYQVWQYNNEVTKNKDKIKFCFQTPSTDFSNKIFNIDSLRFTQIIDNLLLNAFRFTSTGTITLGYDSFDDDHLMIYVSDTGTGISSGDLLTIFERFRQVDELKVRSFSGTGLGLAITRKLVEHLSGEIWVESTLGKGSTFFLKFPVVTGKALAKPSAPPSGQNMPTKPGNIEGKKILIVEDNDSSFGFLEILLKRKGASIQRAITGGEAIDKSEKEFFDIILMDLQLPEMSGFDAIKNIRTTNKHIPIIVQTAFSEQNEREQAFDAGCDLYLIKPITKQKLENALLKFC